jgi:hypothetical protein
VLAAGAVSTCSFNHYISVTDIVNSDDELAPLMPYNVVIWREVVD